MSVRILLFGPSWAPRGPSSASLGQLRCLVGVQFGSLGATWRSSWAVLDAVNTKTVNVFKNTFSYQNEAIWASGGPLRGALGAVLDLLGGLLDVLKSS